jgi:ATP-dependent Lhr-like helicase
MSSDDEWRRQADQMRAALPQTWYPFFARFPRPAPVQLASWQPLLSGIDCVICSPTASGKTEAVVAPLVERHLTPGAAGKPRLLVVSPTRALVNDLVRRLQEPLARLSLGVQRRTGDHARLDRQRPPQVLVTTPESLDSLMVRHLGFLRQLRAVILDELHILDGTPRGDQLRILLARLRAVTTTQQRRLQVVACSATIHDPQGLAGRYLESAKVVSVAGAKELEVTYAPCSAPHQLLATIDRVWGPTDDCFRKILVFVARRADVERLTSLAHTHPRLGTRVYAHHGSLSRSERERVEERFAADPSAICFATMTLELGVDIGDVDLVVLAEPPTSVASLLQRVGRGNRRSNRCHLLACFQDPGELARLRHLVELARQGELCPQPYHFRPSVLVQQAGSLLLQSRTRWLTAEVLESRLPAGVAQSFGRERLAELLAELARNQWLAPGRHGRYIAGERLLKAYERGDLHGNLGAELRTVEVIEESTGRSLGQVMREPERAPALAIGGRTRQVIRESGDQVWVEEIDGEAADARFAPRGRQTISAALARSLAESLGVEVGQVPVVELAEGIAVLHFQGSLAGEVLARHLRKKHGWQVKRGAALALILDQLPETDRPPVISGEGLEAEVGALAKRLARLADAGPYHRNLPEPWQLQLLHDVIDCSRIARAWSSSQFVVPANEEQAETLAALAGVR